MNFANLPLNVQSEIKSTLSAFSECTVTQKESGDYKVMTCTVVHNGVYDKHIGRYKAEDVFTVEERIINYVKAFKDYPFMVNGITYKGTQDWQMLNSNWKDVIMNDNGDLEFIF